MAEAAEKLGMTKQAVYQRVKAYTEKEQYTKQNGAAYGIDKVKAPKIGSGHNTLYDPKTGLVVDAHGSTSKVIARMGDEKVSDFVTYHMECLAMRQGVDKKNVQDLYNRFMRYLTYCQQHGVIPGAANARLAIGVSQRDIHDWEFGLRGTPEHRQFAEDFKAVMASVNEQAAADGIINPVLSIFWSKAYYGLSDQPKVEVEVTSPLGEKKSAEEISRQYADILPEDN